MQYETIVLLVGRDDWLRDDALNQRLADHLRRAGVRVVWEDAAAEMIYCARRLERRLPWRPRAVQALVLRLVQVAYGLAHPSYLRYLLQRRDRSVPARCQSLRTTVRRLGVAGRIVVLARSSGGRVASLVADELGLRRIVCLGYPFKHPEQPDEPERYRHLATLMTPMLILQGTRDVYGGEPAARGYRLSDAVTLRFIDTNHEFELAGDALDDVLDAMMHAVRG